MFAGILKKGSGLGPAITFLYAGPAINILAIVYTARVLGLDLGLARAVSAIVLSILIGLIMMKLFPQHDEETTKTFGAARKAAVECADTRPKWVVPAFFVLLIAILLIGTSLLPSLLPAPHRVLPLHGGRIPPDLLLHPRRGDRMGIRDLGPHEEDLPYPYHRHVRTRCPCLLPPPGDIRALLWRKYPPGKFPRGVDRCNPLYADTA